MTAQQMDALMDYIRAVARSEAVRAVDGHTEGGYDEAERAAEHELRAALLPPKPAGQIGGMSAERLLDGYAGCRAFDEWRGF